MPDKMTTLKQAMDYMFNMDMKYEMIGSFLEHYLEYGNVIEGVMYAQDEWDCVTYYDTPCNNFWSATC